MTVNAQPKDKLQSSLVFDLPTVEDGQYIWQLVKNTGVLDLNSSYSYLLWAKYFSKTSIVVKLEQKVVGFISAFIAPEKEDTLFVWQVAVDESMRGKGLATRMLREILCKKICRNIRYLETTVTPSNVASIALFKKLAKDLKTQYTILEGFTEEQFPEKGHEAEELYKIGPFSIKNINV